MSIEGIRQLADALDGGANWISFFSKTSGPASFGVRWADLSMGAGQPKYNAYVGGQAEATRRFGAGNDGIYLGPTPLPGQEKRLTTAQIQTTSTTLTPAALLLADTVLFYPLIDGDDTELQALDNPVTLPRYTTGAGLRMFAVCTTPMTADAVVSVSYTNNRGVAGRLSVCRLAASTVVGCIVSAVDSSTGATRVGPWLPLADGDAGVRSIQSVQMQTASGGFFAIVLVRPLVSLALPESTTPAETDFRNWGKAPRVFDGAYLNFIYAAGLNGTAVPFRGFLEFAWG
jgi:hypothetical protein